MKESARNLFAKAKEAHETLYRILSELRSETEKCNNYVELCDYALAVDQSHQFVEDSKKELWKLREAVNQKVCELWLSAAMRNPHNFPRSIYTDYVTATPDIKQVPNIPSIRSNPEAHKKLMDYLGIDMTKWPVTEEEGGEKKVSEVVKIHWPGFVNLVTESLSAGLPAPPGVDISKMMPVYKLVLRKQRDVLDDPPEVSVTDLDMQEIYANAANKRENIKDRF